MDQNEAYRVLISEEHTSKPFKKTPKALVGDKLASADEFQVGPGVYSDKRSLFAAVIGDVFEVSNASGQKPFLTVSSSRQAATAVPRTGSIVYAEVQKVGNQRLDCIIKVSDGEPIDNEFKGILRQQDVRQFETDKLQLRDCFRPGDIIRAVVLSMGDSRSFLLSTATNDLGVVFGKSKAGGELKPVSWNTMKCSLTGEKEPRKVAQPLEVESAMDTE